MKKRRNAVAALALAGGVSLMMIGCGKQNEQAPVSMDDMRKTADKSVSEATSPAQAAKPAEIAKPVEAAKPAAPPTVSEAQKSVTEAASAGADQAQGMIDKAKTLVAEKKYTEALASLKELSSLKLTPEQQKIVDDLSAQAQKSLASAAAEEATKKAAGAAGGLLGK